MTPTHAYKCSWIVTRADREPNTLIDERFERWACGFCVCHGLEIVAHGANRKASLQEAEISFFFKVSHYREPNPWPLRIHDRMPVILDPMDYDGWLDPSASPEALRAMLKPYPAEGMESYAVSRVVNSVKNDVPECIEPEAPS